MTLTRTILPRGAAALILGAAALPLASGSAAAPHPARDDAFAFHGTTGATHRVALQGGRYVINVYAGPNPGVQPAGSPCSFTASLSGVEHPIAGGMSTLGSLQVGSYAPYHYIPTLNLPAGHYTLTVSPLTDCSWSVAIGGGGSGRPVVSFGDTGIYHLLDGRTEKTVIVETNDTSYTFGFTYAAWGAGFAAPAASVTVLQGNRALHTYKLAPAAGEYGQTAFTVGRTFHPRSADQPGVYTARFTAMLGGQRFMKSVDYTVQALAPGHWVVQAAGTAAHLSNVACPGVSTCISPGKNATIVATTDGHTWSRIATPLDTASFLNLYGVACPTARVCYVVGEQYFILGSKDGGRTWSTQNGDGTYTSLGQDLVSVACPTERRCYTVGFGGIIATTTDGGGHWTMRQSFASGKDLVAVTCPSASVCYAVGADGAVARTTDSGSTWQRSAAGKATLFSIDCPTARLCYAAGQQGTILVTADGGSTWRRQNNPLDGSHLWVDSVSCSSARACHAVGQGGTLLLTTDGGRSWRTQRSPTRQQLNVVTCPAADACYAVDMNGTILKGA